MTEPRSAPKYKDCPFEVEHPISSGGDAPHIEGRFSRLESEVSGLKDGFESMQKSMAENFRGVFNKIDSIGTNRSAAILPWIAMFLVVAGLAGKMVYADLSGQAEAILDVKHAATQELKDINSRLYQSQYERGKYDSQAAGTYVKLRELDTKLQTETQMTAATLKEQIRALDEKLQVESRLQSRTVEASIAKQDEYTTEMRAWRLRHVENSAYSQGLQDAKISGLEKQLTLVEERQAKDRQDRATLGDTISNARPLKMKIEKE